MFDINSLIGDQVERLRPAVTAGAEECRGWGREVLRCLYRINESLQTEDYREQRAYLPLSGLAAGEEREVFTVPPTEEWTVELVTVSNVETPGGSMQLTVGGVAALIAPLAAEGTVWGYGLLLQGNTTVRAVNTSDGAADVFVQVKKRVKPAPIKGHGGVREVPVSGDNGAPLPAIGRHTGTWETR